MVADTGTEGTGAEGTSGEGTDSESSADELEGDMPTSRVLASSPQPALRGRSLAYVTMNPKGANSILILRVQMQQWSDANQAYGPVVGPAYCDEACVRVSAKNLLGWGAVYQCFGGSACRAQLLTRPCCRIVSVPLATLV